MITYEKWQDIPTDLKTRNQFDRIDRRVNPKARPRAFCQEFNVNLWHFDDTVPIPISEERAAVKTLYHLLIEGSLRHITPVENQWYTIKGRLSLAAFKNHLTGREIYGIYGSIETNWLAIDVDLHKGDPAVFLDQVRVLLDEFHGKDGWHYQVRDVNAKGIHFIKYLPEAMPTEMARRELREKLITLDIANPELATRADESHMKAFSGMEIFPDIKRGFRLPVCQGRTMLIDKPLEKIKPPRYRRAIPNYIHYAEWVVKCLQKSENHYMSKKDVIDYLKSKMIWN